MKMTEKNNRLCAAQQALHEAGKSKVNEITPPPWTADLGSDARTRGYILDADGLAVAKVTTTSRKYAEFCANAHLIAAAPDLLHALEALSNWLAFGLARPDGAEPTDADLKLVEALGEQARAAVDKAKGK